MKATTYLKILAAVLLMIIATLFAYSMEVSFWINSHRPVASANSATENLQTSEFAKYDSRTMPPIALGGIKKSENAYIRLKLRFRAESLDGNPNLFQTAPLNRGMRLEISGSTAALVVADSGVPGGLKGIPVTTALKSGQWYTLEIEALNGSFVRATLDRVLVASYTSPSLSFEMSELLVGGGYDVSRAFRGQMEDISVTRGNPRDASSIKSPKESPEAYLGAPYTYGLAAEGAQTSQVAKYDSRTMSPIALGGIKSSDSAYIRLKLRFRANSTEGNPNLFQTAPLNRGMRLEISGSTAALVVPDSAAPGGLKGIPVATALKAGQWYTLEVEALNRSFVRATLDGVLVANYSGAGLSMEMSELLVGGGFDVSRAFRGQLEDISVTRGNFSAPVAFGDIKNSDNSYIRLKFRFRAENTEGNPNLFQTAPFNKGMRLEISGSTATILIPDLAERGGLRGLTLTTALKTGQWYELEVEALNRAFVRALLDARPIFNYAGPGISMDTSQILVGGGFDSSRAFRGQVQNISVLKGNLPQLPHRSLMLVYSTLLILSALFFLTLWKALGEHKGVQKIVGKLIFLGFPLIFMLGYLEYRLSFVNTLYYAKRVAFEEQLDQIEVLGTGSSNGLYGVAPEAFSRKGFNLAFPANEMYYDAKLIEKYLEKMPKLRVVILTVNYSTMGSDDRESTNSWRHFFMRQYFGIPTELSAGRLFDWGFWLNPHNFSKIALYGVDAKAYANTNFLTPVDIITSSSGWFNSGDVDAPLAVFGVNAAAAHNVLGDVKNYDRNLGNWETLIPLLKRKNVIPIIVVPPTDVSYYRHLDKAKIGSMNQKLTEFTNRHGIKFVDYTYESRFSLNDYTWEMPDHINQRGAMKFSRMLDEEVSKVQR